ncbi:MAG: T9SS type A sorting domain-containing protein [Bacteroidota bacterium]
MRSIIFLLFTLLAIQVYSQITVETTDMPEANDIYVMSTYDSAGQDYALTGADFLWDFSWLSYNNQRVDTYLVAAATNPAYAYFFQNSLGVKGPVIPNGIPNLEVSDNYNFYKTDTNMYVKLGMGAKVNGLPMPMKYDVPELYYSLPLNYGNLDSSLSYYGINLPTIGYYGQTVKRINTCDGWGQLTTPYGIFDVLRVKVDLFYTDTFYYEAYSYGNIINRNQTEYHWLAKNNGVPMLMITETGMQTTVLYQDSLRGSEGIFTPVREDLQFVLYPNPAMGSVTLQSDIPIYDPVCISVMDMDGNTINKVVANGIGKSGFIIDTEMLTSGCYLVRMEYSRTCAARILVIP